MNTPIFYLLLFLSEGNSWHYQQDIPGRGQWWYYTCMDRSRYGFRATELGFKRITNRLGDDVEHGIGLRDHFQACHISRRYFPRIGKP